MSKIYQIKLTNGDELFTEMIELTEDDYHYYLKNPLIAGELVNSTTGSTSITLNKYIGFINDEYIPIKKDHVMIICEATSLLVNYYLKSLEYNQKIIEPYLGKQITNIYIQMDNILNDRHPLYGIIDTEESNNLQPDNIPNNIIMTSNTIH